MTAVTPPLVDAVIDERTKAELQPPCDFHDEVLMSLGGRWFPTGMLTPCSSPASWTIRIRFDCGFAQTTLSCDRHHEHITQRLRQLHHGRDPIEPFTVESAERL